MRLPLFLCTLLALLFTSAHAFEDTPLAVAAAQYQQLIRDGRFAAGQSPDALLQQAGQQAARKDWTAAIASWPPATTSAGQREYDLLQVRSRDLLEHIERVVRHVRRLEQNAETTVQMHFSAQGHRTNEIMRTLTALTAVFLPLNLITGFFGMNFDFLPLVHRQAGIWWATGIMSAVAVALVAVFWRKRYLARTGR